MELNQLKTKAEKVVAIAEEQVNNPMEMQTSAHACLDDAKRLLAEGKYSYAIKRAINSLDYSCGIFHEAYKRARLIQMS
jgi:dTDP-4-dehydrorhamnose reductase